MKQMNRWAVIALTLMTSIVTSCNLDNDEDNSGPIGPGAFELTDLQQEMLKQSNSFSLNLFKQIIDSRSADESLKNQSLIISPISITYALGMLNNGAAGNTQEQINKVLGFESVGADAINDYCLKMLRTAPILDPKTKIMIANTIYMNKGYNLRPEFIQKAKTYYDACPETRDFHDGKTMDVINKWASDHTERMIEKVLNESSFNPDAVSYLLNAIYFKGEWTTKFEKELTEEREFMHAGDTKDLTMRPMMRMNAELEYAEIDGYQVLRLPFGNKSYQMTILLPLVKDDKINVLPAVPSEKTWSKINKNMSSHTVDLLLPRIETKSEIDLPEIMSALGMPDAFNSEKADFSKFCDADTYIALMKQVATINLDEDGAEVSAVTVIGMDNAAYSPIPFIKYFYADHPFIYIISEKSTNAIFFIGQYTGY